jgi:hypothetical protein
MPCVNPGVSTSRPRSRRAKKKPLAKLKVCVTIKINRTTVVVGQFGSRDWPDSNHGADDAVKINRCGSEFGKKQKLKPV